MGSIECERPKNVQKIIVQWDIPPAYPNFKKNPLNLLQKKKKKKARKNFNLLLKYVKNEKNDHGL